MNNLNYDQKQEILDFFGEKVIDFRDRSLNIAMSYATGKSVNHLKAEQYKVLRKLSNNEREAVYDLLSETITDTIFNFLDMFEANASKMKLLILKDGEEYDLNEISEKMGGEIAFMDEEGWIQKFSRVGRFVL